MDKVNVTGVNLLNVLVQHFTMQHSLGGVCVNALIRWPPEAVMKVNENCSVEEADCEEGQPEVATRMLFLLRGVIEVQSGFGLADENELVTEKSLS